MCSYQTHHPFTGPMPSAGEVPNLFAKDEVVTILEGVTTRAKKAAAGQPRGAGGAALTPAGLWAFFVESCRCAHVLSWAAGRHACHGCCKNCITRSPIASHAPLWCAPAQHPCTPPLTNTNGVPATAALLPHRANLHLVLAMSPVGNAFRERLRK